MNKQDFWTTLETCKNTDTETYFSNLQAALRKLPEKEQKDFNAYAGAYLGAVSDCIWLDMACKVINGYVSDDTSLYFTLWVIAQGETVLLNAVLNPDSLAGLPQIPFGEADFELLMSAGFSEELYEAELDMNVLEQFETFEAFEKFKANTKQRPPVEEEVQNSIVFKNGDKYGGYKSFEDAMDDIPNVLPNLIARAQKEGFPWDKLYEF